MSDLQLSLLAVGAVFVAAVWLYNRWQERRFRRGAEAAFAHEQPDVLMADAENGATPAISERLEPSLGGPAGSAGVAPAAAAAADRSGLDPAIDFIADLDAELPLAPADLQGELVAGWAAAAGRPVRVAAFDDETNTWIDARTETRRFRSLRCGVQMASRAGCMTAAELAGFCDAVGQWAERQAAQARFPEIEAVLARARQLDALCAEVDVAIGINVIARAGDKFTATRIRAYAEGIGFKLEPSGVFTFAGADGTTLFTLDNHEPMPFVPEQIKTLSTDGVTLLLDVPRVPDAASAFDRMLETGRHLATALGGRLVDDNRAALSEAGLGKIREQLAAIRNGMQAGGIAPGSERALRLFA
ncbi:MAG: cell division protein ZipA C-terminal FtsZ-binding domain-containing protein [Burkholderiales bacterium]